MRSFTILAQDPAVLLPGGRALTTQVWLPAERLRPGPKGHRVHVIDFDAAADRYRAPGTGDPTKDEFIGVEDIDRLVRNPHFHAQNVYAIVMSTLGEFEAALGRRVSWAFSPGHQLKVSPHAFAEANAYYSRALEGLAFGYFPSRDQTLVYTCLSRDVVAHETTHALIDALRSGFLRPSSADQAAFHEGFADIVALLSVFESIELVDVLLAHGAAGGSPLIAASELEPVKLRESVLLTLAEQMGETLTGVRDRALRASAQLVPSPHYLDQPVYDEPHTRGEILVAAVMNAFLEVWVKRLKPLRLTPRQPLNRRVVAEEGATAAQQLLRIAIRALDYCPPIDLSFDDFLSAALTADVELYPDDSKYHYRDSLLSNCRAFGIRPSVNRAGGGVWDPPLAQVSYEGLHFESLQRDPETVFRFLWENAAALDVDDGPYTRVTSVRPCMRVGTDQFTIRETVAEYVQTAQVWARELRQHGIRRPTEMRETQLVTLYGGGTLIFDEFGRLKYHVGKGLWSDRQSGRLQSLWDHGFYQGGEAAQSDFAQLHRDRVLQRRTLARERW